ncbi:hypothetical protein [Sinorhizobium fredii]|uniref:Uncharacterized protein n=1 Tax=Rhizobium fredii TaxID=380 RepID=A0A2A6LZ78_RHIFR|nr:hypothetical protein [Sinorhizobium fredii]ASY68416.1 hypothetical protein SF83666_c09780 [Sinorhizobium fredii CCBAU 83666]AWI56684.1 hypothetical protein AB395_00001008 [Sinorhizobium fredii CCBAU 45436]PDT47536.1 hypothetical protein CO661_12470 [Sinorhizobium fredii]
MGIFVVSADKGAFLTRGESVRRLPEQTDFYLFAETKDDAKKLAAQYIGERIGHSSNIQSQAIFDTIEGWVQRASGSDFLSAIEGVVAETSAFIGSINIEGFAVISPEQSDDTLIVSLSEDNRKRTLIETLYNREKGAVEWGDDMRAFNVTGLSKAIQSLF